MSFATPHPMSQEAVDRPEEPSSDEFAAEAIAAIRRMTRELRAVLGLKGIKNPIDTNTRVQFKEQDAAAYTLPSGWHPGAVFSYSSEDPFQAANPEVAEAVKALIGESVRQARILRQTNDPTLTYLSSQRSRGGRSRAPLTQALAEMDAGFTDWMDNLPAAERLRPVAHPESGGTTFVKDRTTGEIKELATTAMMSAIFIGAADGRAVREREAWEREMIRRFVSPEKLSDGRLTITSLGAGTGEPAMDAGIDVMRNHFGAAAKVIVNGFDLNEDSLSVAQHLAQLKCAALNEPQLVSFVARTANLLSSKGIRESVADTSAQVYESIGFMEYVPSDHATSAMEIDQRRFMSELGCLSAEDFYGEVYDNMPQGSVLLSGNIRDDSPEAPFVVDVVGWKGVIQRSTTQYLHIIERAGIPRGAVQLFVPDKGCSAGVCNLVSIDKS